MRYLTKKRTCPKPIPKFPIPKFPIPKFPIQIFPIQPKTSGWCWFSQNDFSGVESLNPHEVYTGGSDDMIEIHPQSPYINRCITHIVIPKKMPRLLFKVGCYLSIRRLLSIYLSIHPSIYVSILYIMYIYIYIRTFIDGVPLIFRHHGFHGFCCWSNPHGSRSHLQVLTD